MTKWTPGPWENQGEEAFADIPFIRIGVGDRTICEVLPPVDVDKIDDETLFANVNLILAAPDMYAALKMVSGMDLHHEVLAVVDAAMRKARGE